MTTKILIIGACGQIGTELTTKLRSIYGNDNVIASDIRKLNNDIVNNGIFEVVNALDYNQIEHLIEQYQITDVYLMAALLSATAEKNPAFAWDLNMNSLFHVLNLAKAKKNKKDILAFEYCGIRTYNSARKYTTVYHHGTHNGIRNFQTNGRALVRILPSSIRCRRAQYSVSGID